MSEENRPPAEPDDFWGPAPVLPPQPAYTLPPDPTMTVPGRFEPTVPFEAPRDYARWEWRVVATLIDGALLTPWWVMIVAGGGVSSPSTGTESHALTLGRLLVYIGLAGGVLFAFWNNVIRQGIQGATLGKSWIGMRVIGEETGYEIGFGRSLMRYLLHVVNLTPFLLGYLWPLWDKKNQTFSDKIMGTVVVNPVI